MRMRGGIPLRTVLPLVFGGLFAAPACAQRLCPPEIPMQAHPRLDAGLVRVIADTPDSTVGVLVVASATPGAEEREALRRAGLQVGVVAGDVVTGRIRACDAIRLAELAFVRSVQLAREIPRPAPPMPE
jgi:hypothetical protein